MEIESKSKANQCDEEHSVLKNKNIQELQNALKPRVSFSDDLPLSPNKAKSGRSSKDSPKLLRKDDLKKTSSKLAKAEDSPKCSPTILKKFAKQVTSPKTHVKTDLDGSYHDIPLSTTLRDSPKVQKSILKDSGLKAVKVMTSKPEVIGKNDDELQQQSSNYFTSNLKHQISQHILKSEVSASKESIFFNDSYTGSPKVESKTLVAELSEKEIIKSVMDKKENSILPTGKPSVKFSSEVEDGKGLKDLKSKEGHSSTLTPQKILISTEEKKKPIDTDLKNKLSAVSSRISDKTTSTKNVKESVNNSSPIASNKKLEAKLVNKDYPKEPAVKMEDHSKDAISKSYDYLRDQAFKGKEKPMEAVPNMQYILSKDVSKPEGKFKDPSLNVPISKAPENPKEPSFKTCDKKFEKFEDQNVSKKNHELSQKINTSRTFNELDVEAIRLADSILFTPHSQNDEDKDEKQTPADSSKKAKLNMRPITKHHVEEQYSLDHEAIKVSNNIFSDKTKLTEKELQGNNEKLQNQQKQYALTESSKLSPIVKHESNKSSQAVNHESNKSSQAVNHESTKSSQVVDHEKTKSSHEVDQESINSSPLDNEAKQSYLVNKAVISDKPPSSKYDLKWLAPKQAEKQDASKPIKENLNSLIASSVIYAKQDAPKVSKETETSSIASNVIFSKSSREVETKLSLSGKSGPGEIKSASKEAAGKNNLNVTGCETPAYVRRRRVHEEDHRLKVSSSLGMSRFEAIDFDASRPVLRNATHTDLSSSKAESSNPIPHASSFAFESKPVQATPQTQRRFLDRNLNVAPAPYSSKYNVHFSENTDTGSSREMGYQSSSYQKPSTVRSETTVTASIKEPGYQISSYQKPTTSRFELTDRGSSREKGYQSSSYQKQSTSRFELTDTGSNREKGYQISSYQKPATSRSETTSPNRYYGDTVGNSTLSSSYSSTNTSRAKSEGYNRFGGLLGESVVTSSSSNSDLMKKIQASKDIYKQSYEKAMNFDRTTSSKPVVIIPKLPRPGNNYDRLLENAERDKYLRKMERERSVMEKVLSDRGPRSTSIHK